MGVTAVGWAVTIAVIAALLGFDLLLATARPHAAGYREATDWSALYIAVAVAFGLVFATLTGWGYGAQYFAGYIVEKSLSVDNLFVFVIIMATFAVPREHQQGCSPSASSLPWPCGPVFPGNRPARPARIPVKRPALILAFIGAKLILHWGHGLDHRVPEISTATSLTVTAVVLIVTIAASLIKIRRDPTARAHAGAVLGSPPEAASDEHRPAGRRTGPAD